MRWSESFVVKNKLYTVYTYNKRHPQSERDQRGNLYMSYV